MTQVTYSGDQEVLEAALGWLQQGEQAILVTVVQTWGSSPRRPGSLMVMHPDGRFVGSVSGGCVEDELVQRMFKGEFSQGCLPQVIKYGISIAQTQRVGLPCGGQISLLLEELESASSIQTILSQLEQKKLVRRRVCLNTGEVSLHPLKQESLKPLSGSILEHKQHEVIRLFGPAWRMLLIGAGDLSQRVASLAMTLDYQVSIWDPRPEYAANWQVEHCNLLTMPATQLMAHFQPDKRCCVLALSHTATLDDPPLIDVLQSQTGFYVGALGSRKSQQQRIRRLRKAGVSEQELEELHAPIGLDIGSHSPAEIAIAIMADLIRERNLSLDSTAEHKPEGLDASGELSNDATTIY